MLSMDTAFKAQVHLQIVLGRNVKVVNTDCLRPEQSSQHYNNVCEAAKHKTSPLMDEQLTQYDTLESNNLRKYF